MIGGPSGLPFRTDMKLPDNVKFYVADTETTGAQPEDKRWVGYGREPASLNAILVLAHVVFRVSRELGLVPATDATESHIRAVNMAKLLKRYPGGDFDAFRALQRDLGAERATLESAVLG